ncbi:MAG: DUF3791 domain-containing protein [Muribaculaceae bacterium]|nr:DUF3791 domain-containing protein [Muribaculaceae bacterium]
MNNSITKTELQDTAYFVSFCIEQYKHHKHMTGAEAYELFERHGVLVYLVENYEILHSQNHHWIAEDIDEFINSRQKA